MYSHVDIIVQSNQEKVSIIYLNLSDQNTKKEIDWYNLYMLKRLKKKKINVNQAQMIFSRTTILNISILMEKS